MEKIYGMAPDTKAKMLSKAIYRAINLIVIWVILYVGIIGFIFDNTDSALIGFIVGAVIFAPLLYSYINMIKGFRVYLNSGLQMVLTDSKLTCEIGGELYLDLNLNEVTFVFDSLKLKYRMLDGQEQTFEVYDLIGYDQFLDLSDTLNKMGKMENYGFKDK